MQQLFRCFVWKPTSGIALGIARVVGGVVYVLHVFFTTSKRLGKEYTPVD